MSMCDCIDKTFILLCFKVIVSPCCLELQIIELQPYLSHFVPHQCPPFNSSRITHSSSKVLLNAISHFGIEFSKFPRLFVPSSAAAGLRVPLSKSVTTKSMKYLG